MPPITPLCTSLREQAGPGPLVPGFAPSEEMLQPGGMRVVGPEHPELGSRTPNWAAGPQTGLFTAQ